MPSRHTRLTQRARMSAFVTARCQIDRGLHQLYLPLSGRYWLIFPVDSFLDTTGYDRQGQLTTDAAKILESERPLPIGYWKGFGLSLTLDLLATLMSGGSSSYQVGQRSHEYGVSQVYLAIDISRAAPQEAISQIVTDTLTSLTTATLAEGSTEIRYPGERILSTREQYLANGIPIDLEIWQAIREY